MDVLPGRASAIQATRGDGIGRLGGASSEQLWQVSQHSRSACSSRQVPGSTGRQDNKDGAGCSSRVTFRSTCSKDCGAHTTFSNVRRVTEPTPYQNGNGNPRRVSHCWQVTKETPLPRKTRWTKAEKCAIPSGSQLIQKGLSDGHLLGKSRGTQWLQRCPTARYHLLWLVRSLEHISAPTAEKTLQRAAETQN